MPNGGARHPAVAAKLKAEGVRPGVPDLFLAAPSGRDVLAKGLWIELKRHPNRPSAEQEAVIAYLRRQGYHCVVAYGFDEAKMAIEGYLGK